MLTNRISLLAAVCTLVGFLFAASADKAMCFQQTQPNLSFTTFTSPAGSHRLPPLSMCLSKTYYSISNSSYFTSCSINPFYLHLIPNWSQKLSSFNLQNLTTTSTLSDMESRRFASMTFSSRKKVDSAVKSQVILVPQDVLALDFRRFGPKLP